MAEPYRVSLTRSAFDDLDMIGDYAAQARGLDDANDLVERLRQHVLRLDLFPYRGPIPKELESLGRSDVRQTVLGTYRIFYRILEQDIFVFMFVDGRRDIDTLLVARLRDLGTS